MADEQTEEKKAAGATAAAAATQKKAEATEKAEARVLVATDDYAVDDIITGKAADVAVAAGWADDHPSAVAYAKNVRG